MFTAVFTTVFTTVAASDVFAIDVISVARLLGLAVPLLVALITKRWASQGLKAILNLVLAAVSGAIAPVLAGNGGPDSIGELFNLILNSFITSIVVYYGLYKPTGVSAAFADATARVGLGSNDRGFTPTAAERTGSGTAGGSGPTSS